MSSLLEIRNDPEKYKEFFATHDRLGALFGTKIISINATECLGEYTASSAHFNPNGILHGGALYSVMDSNQGAFVHFILELKYRAAATGTATIRYEAPVRGGKVRIHTWLKGQEGRKLFVLSEAKNDEGNLLASLEEVWITIS